MQACLPRACALCPSGTQGNLFNDPGGVSRRESPLFLFFFFGNAAIREALSLCLGIAPGGPGAPCCRWVGPRAVALSSTSSQTAPSRTRELTTSHGPVCSRLHRGRVGHFSRERVCNGLCLHSCAKQNKTKKNLGFLSVLLVSLADPL